MLPRKLIEECKMVDVISHLCVTGKVYVLTRRYPHFRYSFKHMPCPLISGIESLPIFLLFQGRIEGLHISQTL